MVKDFRAFVLRGNVVDLAVGVVIGAAFGTIVAALVADFLTPLIGAIVGKQSFANLSFKVNSADFLYGDFINKLLSFLLIAAVVFYLVVKPMNYLMTRARREPPAEPDTTKCPECLSVIPIAARRCAYCTALQPGAATP
ncbi:MAG TPA: large conductance mechanosensitive channel protein MscL [Candidatus Dormibacteraeota bacterium]|nr:large conductance mechanosensitive channel protein MscL [Candidatus Dormibacteraeota bacterium]